MGEYSMEYSLEKCCTDAAQFNAVPPANFDANSVHFHTDPVYFALDPTHFNADPAYFVLNPDFFFWLNFVCIRLIIVLRLLILIYSTVDTTAYFGFSLDPAHFVADSAHLDYLLMQIRFIWV